ncbi:MAG: glycosyltransferase, partial [Candidatus Pacearchaeota archaeon]|nr:glycosyltransferase [Candidatus Pacearchaeota archaeon]
KNLKCIIVGDGPEMNNLKQLTKSLNLNKNIIFKGFVKESKEVISLMKSSKVFVLPSEREGFGITVIEANACGIPVITVNHKGNASQYLVQNNKNGYITNLNEKDIAEAISKTLKKKKEDWKTSQYVQKYDWSKIIKMFEEVYSK